MDRRIHITGASGSGVSTLGRALAGELASQAFDTDDFYWVPTDPPFTEKRLVAERIALMEQVFLPRGDWILSGSLHTWGGPIMERVTHVIFLTLPASARLARLRARERTRYGARIAPGGDRAESFRAFLDWAMSYDEGDEGPSRRREAHEAWLETLVCPVIRLTADVEPDALVTQALTALDEVDHAA
ncbi:MAG: hypothetical protein AAFR35_00645 [Pseudomonadota bacterium]